MSDPTDRHNRYPFDPDDYPEAKLPAATAGDFVVSRGLLVKLLRSTISPDMARRLSSVALFGIRYRQSKRRGLLPIQDERGFLRRARKALAALDHRRERVRQGLGEIGGRVFQENQTELIRAGFRKGVPSHETLLVTIVHKTLVTIFLSSVVASVAQAISGDRVRATALVEEAIRMAWGREPSPYWKGLFRDMHLCMPADREWLCEISCALGGGQSVEQIALSGSPPQRDAWSNVLSDFWLKIEGVPAQSCEGYGPVLRERIDRELNRARFDLRHRGGHTQTESARRAKVAPQLTDGLGAGAARITPTGERASEPDPAAEAERRDALAAIQRELDEQEWEAILAAAEHGENYSAIARALGTSDKTARLILERARRKARRISA